METVVRPFQSPQVTPPTIVPFSHPTRTDERVLIQIGRIGATRTFRGSMSVTSTVYVPTFDKHAYQIYEVVRVYDRDNPDGDDNLGYVDMSWVLVSHFVDVFGQEKMVRFPEPTDQDFIDYEPGSGESPVQLKWKIITPQLRQDLSNLDFMGAVV